MDRFIIDASVGAKWFVEEEHQEKALYFLERFKKNQCQITVPEIFYAELVNTFLKKVIKKDLTIDHAVEAIDHLMKLSLDPYSDKELAEVALENAFRFNVSVYDGLYLALAEIYLAPLVTADEELLKACDKRFEFIESLKDISLE